MRHPGEQRVAAAPAGAVTRLAAGLGGAGQPRDSTGRKPVFRFSHFNGVPARCGLHRIPHAVRTPPCLDMALVARVGRARVPAFAPATLRRGFADVVVVGASVMDMVRPPPPPAPGSLGLTRLGRWRTWTRCPPSARRCWATPSGHRSVAREPTRRLWPPRCPPHTHAPPPPTLTHIYARVTS
eukprot:COSAG04_NODE_3207_length_3049_cov_35.068814_2_plen_183_part_00